MNLMFMKVKEALEDNFDITYIEKVCHGQKITFVYSSIISDKDDINQNIIKPFNGIGKLEFNEVKRNKVIGNLKAQVVDNYKKAIILLLSGNTLIFYHNCDEIIICKSKNKIKREVRIPPTESVIRGPREGFVEDININVGLVRTRLINLDFKLIKFYVGEESNTEVVMGYIKDIAPFKLVEYVKEKIQNKDTNYVLDSNYIASAFEKKETIFDTVGYTEKPDRIAGQLLEGKVCVFVAGSPFVLTLPFFFIEHFHTADDYYQNKYIVTMSRIIKYTSFFIGLLLPGMYLSLVTFHFSFIPLRFLFRLASSRAGVPIPTFLELFFMMFFFYLSKEAALRLPKNIGGSLSIVAGLVLGQTSVEAGIASQITVVIAGLYAITSFVNANLGKILYLWSSIIIVFVALIGFPGLIMGAIICVAHIASLDSCGYPFLFPVSTKKNYHLRDLVIMKDTEDINSPVLDEEH